MLFFIFVLAMQEGALPANQLIQQIESALEVAK